MISVSAMSHVTRPGQSARRRRLRIAGLTDLLWRPSRLRVLSRLAGRFFIDDLEPGRYFGIDRSAQHVAAAIQYVLKPANLLAKSPTIRLVELTDAPMALAAILGFARFNYIRVHALFDHIAPTVIRQFEELAREVPGLRLGACLYDYSHPLGLRVVRFIRR